MGMRIGGGSNAWATQQSSSAINWQQRHQNFKTLKTAIQNNDLAGAQQAFAALSANNPQAAANPNSPLAQLGQALQSGNMAAAQQVAQAWQNAPQGNASSKQATDPNAALASFLQTLSASNNQVATTALNTAPNTPDAANESSAKPSTSSPEQVAQALLSFEKNLFDSLQLQNKSQLPSAHNSGTPTGVPATIDPNVADATSGITPPPVNNTPVQQQHHRQHHGGGSGGQALNAELNALIAQNSNSSATSGSSAGLDQSFKSLLSNLGVSGNNASLNSFLQALSSNMQSTQTQA